MKYKVGDRVRIKSLDWYNKNKDKYGIVDLSTHIFTSEMSQFCGKVVTIEDVFEDMDDNVIYYMEEIDYDWTDEMIEGLVEEEMSLDKAGQITDFEYEGLAYTLPDGYIFKDENGNEILTSKIILVKKKKEYPKTYEECCKVLDWNHRDYDRVGYKSDILCKLQVLLICRDAYWKIAGEEKGLEEPWEPDWRKERYIIYRNQDDVIGGYREAGCVEHHIFEFPIKEMRDAFKENFDQYLEICKELL